MQDILDLDDCNLLILNNILKIIAVISLSHGIGLIAVVGSGKELPEFGINIFLTRGLFNEKAHAPYNLSCWVGICHSSSSTAESRSGIARLQSG
jgi:hypothetical protein